MKCNDTGKLIIDKLAGELSPRQATRLDKHLAACENCRKEFEELSQAWQVSDETLKTDTFVTELTPARRSEIFNVAKNEAKRRQPAWLLTRFAEYAFAIAICLVLAGMLLPALNKPRVKTRPDSSQIRMTQAKLLKAQKTKNDEVAGNDNEKEKKLGNNMAHPAVKYAPVVVRKSKAKKYRKTLTAPAPVGMSRTTTRLNERQRSFTARKVTRHKISKERVEMDCKAEVSRKALAPSKLRSLRKIDTAKKRSIKPMNLRCKIQIPPKKIFKLDLKRWNMTTIPDVKKYLKANDCLAPDSIKIYKDKNMIIIHAPDATLKKIDKLFKKLNDKEKELPK